MPAVPKEKKLRIGSRLQPLGENAHPLIRRIYSLTVAEDLAITVLARKAGVSRSLLWGWFQNKKYRVTLQDLEAVLTVLGYQLKIVPKYSEELLSKESNIVPLGTVVQCGKPGRPNRIKK